MKKMVWRRFSPRVLSCGMVGFACLFGWGCASSNALQTSSVTEEVALEDGVAAEELGLPTRTFEYLMRFDPPARDGGDWEPAAVRLRIAQPGTVRWTMYANSSLEQPGEMIGEFVRDYGQKVVGAQDEARWVVETLRGVIRNPHGTIWIGVRKEGGQPKIWAASVNGNRRGGAFVRDLDPSRMLSPMPVRRAPMMRLDWGLR